MEVTKEQVDYMVEQYNLIQQKTCKLSRRQRDFIVSTVGRYVELGIIKDIKTD